MAVSETYTDPAAAQNGSGDPVIVATGVEKWYGAFHVLKGVDLTVNKGEVVVVMGPSGSGKSTFIRTFNALETYQKGSIVIDGVKISHDLKDIESIRREVGMVFQQFNLFPHLTVLENITLAPINVRKWSRERAETLAMEYAGRLRELPHHTTIRPTPSADIWQLVLPETNTLLLVGTQNLTQVLTERLKQVSIPDSAELLITSSGVMSS